MEQQFSLSWKNFHGNLSNGFSGLLDNGEFVDVTLACDGELLQAHKVVLSICSPYFKRMFQLNPCQHPIVVLRDISHHAMRNLIHFMYNGEVSVRQEDLANFISTAETLEIKGLTNKHSDEDKCDDVPKLPSPVTPLNNNVHNSHETNTDSDMFPDDLSHDQTQNQIDVNSIRLAALKRKSEEFIANNFSSDIRDSILPEKRPKFREKQILNRHKIPNNFPRGNISVKNFNTKLRSDIVPNLNMFDNLSNDLVNKKNDKASPFHEVRNTFLENNGRRSAESVNDIKLENDEDNDDSMPKSVITYDKHGDSENQAFLPSRELEQDDGANTVDIPNIGRATWSMTHCKLTSAVSGQASSGGLPLPVQITTAILSSPQHTIVTIPQKEDGKKKYPQRSCRFCWRAGKRRDTRFMCQQCSVPLCKTNCFEQHQSEGFLNGWKDESTVVL